MINEKSLLDTLITLAQVSKSQYQFTLILAHDIAALRETVRVLDPTFADVFEKRQQEAAAATAAHEAGVIAQYDKLIAKMSALLIS